jgi:hypothetical protein
MFVINYKEYKIILFTGMFYYYVCNCRKTKLLVEEGKENK